MAPITGTIKITNNQINFEVVFLNLDLRINASMKTVNNNSVQKIRPDLMLIVPLLIFKKV